jgi:hemin uptake protein HemP
MGEQNGSEDDKVGGFESIGGEGVDSREMVTSSSYSGRLPKIIPFRELCRCGDEVWIENEGQLYRLRRTKQGKLILTK